MGGIDKGAGAALGRAAVRLFLFDGNNTSDEPPLPGEPVGGNHVSLAQGHVLPFLRLENALNGPDKSSGLVATGADPSMAASTAAKPRPPTTAALGNRPRFTV